MKLIIDIPDEDYEHLKLFHEGVTDYQTTLKLYRAVKNGTVLLKGQGEWIRKKDVIHSIAKQYSAHNELVPIWLRIEADKEAENE